MSPILAANQPQTNGNLPPGSSTAATASGKAGESTGATDTSSNLNNISGSHPNEKPSSILKKNKKWSNTKGSNNGKGDVNAKLKCVKDLVEGQPTQKLRNQLYALSEKNLVGLLEIQKANSGVVKLLNNNDLVPASV